NLRGPVPANAGGARGDKVQWSWFATERSCARLDFAARSNVPNQSGRKNKGDQAIRGRSPQRERRGQQTATRPTAARTRRVAREQIANLQALRRGVSDRRAAMRTESDKNPAAKPAESPRANDRS